MLKEHVESMSKSKPRKKKGNRENSKREFPQRNSVGRSSRSDSSGGQGTALSDDVPTSSKPDSRQKPSKANSQGNIGSKINQQVDRSSLEQEPGFKVRSGAPNVSQRELAQKWLELIGIVVVSLVAGSAFSLGNTIIGAIAAAITFASAIVLLPESVLGKSSNAIGSIRRWKFISIFLIVLSAAVYSLIQYYTDSTPRRIDVAASNRGSSIAMESVPDPTMTGPLKMKLRFRNVDRDHAMLHHIDYKIWQSDRYGVPFNLANVATNADEILKLEYGSEYEIDQLDLYPVYFPENSYLNTYLNVEIWYSPIGAYRRERQSFRFLAEMNSSGLGRLAQKGDGMTFEQAYSNAVEDAKRRATFVPGNPSSRTGAFLEVKLLSIKDAINESRMAPIAVECSLRNVGQEVAESISVEWLITNYASAWEQPKRLWFNQTTNRIEPNQTVTNRAYLRDDNYPTLYEGLMRQRFVLFGTIRYRSTDHNCWVRVKGERWFNQLPVVYDSFVWMPHKPISQLMTNGILNLTW